jgi:hypothetical protein
VTRPGAAPGFTTRQEALAARANVLDATGAHYALFHLAFGPETDMDALERALGAADRYQAELRQAVGGAAGSWRAARGAASSSGSGPARPARPPPRNFATATG